MATTYWLLATVPASVESWQPPHHEPLSAYTTLTSKDLSDREMTSPDVMELFGGAAGVTRVALRKNLTCGPHY